MALIKELSGENTTQNPFEQWPDSALKRKIIELEARIKSLEANHQPHWTNER